MLTGRSPDPSKSKEIKDLLVRIYENNAAK
jgi:hypothetical protein